MKLARRGLGAALLLGVISFPTLGFAEDFSVSFDDPAWDGKTIPDGQQCSEYGGNGATPKLHVAGIPNGANVILIEFNDESYEPLSKDGGHGIVGYESPVGTKDAHLASSPGNTIDLSEGMWIEEENRDDIGVVGYLPPCSGGTGNLYSIKVLAVDYQSEDYKILAEAYLALGKY
ncbi:MAG: hypothetical protein P1V34_10730 [Alphaproteobacteria bacterium]|nr:hypothetical protein [Alphaproteobacteria bacterium]